ncbi:hypothetical protein F443_19903, partial [Phytophthora nicotianae P1569]
MEKVTKTERIQNRKRIGLIYDVCLHLARQDIPFRGNNEKEHSLNKGNFLEMLQFMMDRIPEFSKQMGSAAANAKYTSPSIQKELIRCAADL